VSVVFVILNNGAYRILKQRVHALKGLAVQHDRYVGMDLTDPRVDFPALAGSLGVPAERVEKTSEVGPALTRALARGGPVLLDVALDGAFKP
jgi:benzoylformate decarboxylase